MMIVDRNALKLDARRGRTFGQRKAEDFLAVCTSHLLLGILCAWYVVCTHCVAIMPSKVPVAKEKGSKGQPSNKRKDPPTSSGPSSVGKAHRRRPVRAQLLPAYYGSIVACCIGACTQTLSSARPPPSAC